MIDVSVIAPDDRVLMLGIPDGAAIVEIAGRLTRGLLVGIGPEADVLAARRACSACDNVMFVPADPDGVIPWQDQFFSLVIANAVEAQGREVARILARGGRVLVLTS